MNLYEAFLSDRIGFERFNTEHWIWIILYGIVFTSCWIWYARKQTPEMQQKIGLYHGIFGIVTWVITTFAVIYMKGLYLQAVLPFHVCYFLNMFLPVMHWKHSDRIFQICYFWVMAACFQGLITPDLEEPFPHYYNVRYFIVHFGLVQSILYAIFVYGFRPKPIWILGALLVGDLYVCVIHVINKVLNTNFVYTMSKPPKTMLDNLGDHYLIEAQPLALLLFAIVYLPYLFSDLWKKIKSSGATN